MEEQIEFVEKQVIVRVPIYPPAALLKPCEAPDLSPLLNPDATFSDLAILYIDFRLAFEKCAAQMEALNEWYEEVKRINKEG